MGHRAQMGLLFAASFAVPSAAELQRVIVVARHGNRAPNPQVPWVCPKAGHISEQFQEPIHSHQRAALSHVGKCENWESGNFLRETYKETLYGSKDATWMDDGSFFALSERMNRNIVSMEALLYGLWPEGTGEPQFLKTRPNLVPFITSNPYHDTLMNTPRDGPCKDAFTRDTAEWNKQNAAEAIAKNKAVLEKIGAECGFDFMTSKQTIGKDFTWGIKAATDAFAMAQNEGIDATDGGKFNQTVINEALAVAHAVTNQVRFGKKHQITYWLGRFVNDALFANMQDPNGAKKESWEVTGFKSNAKNPWQGTPEDYWNQMKMLIFLNHRELMQSLALLFGYEELLATPLKSGSMIIYEVHKENGEEFIITKAWNPSQPSWQEKHEMLGTTEDLMKLYSTGTVQTVKPAACGNQERCTLQQMRDHYAKWTAETGTWQEICDYPRSAADGARLTAEDDDESYTRFNDAAAFTLAHASEPTGVATTAGPGIPLLLLALAAAVPAAFFMGTRFARRTAGVSPEDYVRVQ